MLGSSDWAMLPDPDLKSVRQYTSKDELSTVNWVLLIAGQFSDNMLFDGVGNAEEVLVDVDVDVGRAELVEADELEVVVTALVTGAPAVLLALAVAIAPLALLPLFVPSLATNAPTTPPTTAPMMTSKITDPMMSAFRFGTPHQRLG